MTANDTINGAIEFVGAIFTWRNLLQLRRDREVKGVYWPATAFWAVWGIWNLYYYPSLGQWLSFSAGAFLVTGNLAWLAMVGWLGVRAKRLARHLESERALTAICICGRTLEQHRPRRPPKSLPSRLYGLLRAALGALGRRPRRLWRWAWDREFDAMCVDHDRARAALGKPVGK